jgi:hypothetical protein
MVGIPHSDIPHVFQSLEQTVSDLRKGSVPEFFSRNSKFMSVGIDSPPHLFITPLRLCVPFYVRVHAEDVICISFYVKQ